VWAIKKDEGQFVDENGKQAINFQITWTVLLIVAAPPSSSASDWSSSPSSGSRGWS